VSAADAATVSVGVHSGFSAPSGDLARTVGDGFHYGISMEYSEHSRSRFGLDANHPVFAQKTSVTPVLGSALFLTEKANVLEAALDVKVFVGPRAPRRGPTSRGASASST
jgi:hypothetical protein